MAKQSRAILTMPHAYGFPMDSGPRYVGQMRTEAGLTDPFEIMSSSIRVANCSTRPAWHTDTLFCTIPRR